MKSGEQNLFFQYLKGIAILFVVMLHSASDGINGFASLTESVEQIRWLYWGQSAFLHAVARPCVPLFLFCSGYFILDVKREFHLPSKLQRLAYPLLFWGAFYFLFRYFILHQTFSLRDIFKEYLRGPVYGHLWYLYGLMGLYIIAPILRTILATKDFQIARYLFFLWFVISGILPILDQVFHVQIGIYRFIGTGSYFGYFLLGGIACQYELSSLVNIKKAFWAFLSGVLLTFFGTVFLSFKNNQPNGLFLDYASPGVLLSTLGLIVLIHDNLDCFHQKWIHKITMLLGKYSLGIYTIHIAFMHCLHVFIYDHGYHRFFLFKNPLIGIPIVSFLTIGLSLLVLKCMEKITPLRKVIF